MRHGKENDGASVSVVRHGEGVRVSERPTIVIVDDSSDVRALVRAQIRLSDRLDVVAEGANGLDAVSLVDRHRPDLMLLDVSMPQSDGLVALPRVLERSPATKVVMYSGFDETGLAARTRELGAADFVEKSIPFDDLLDKLLGLVGVNGAATRSADGGASGSRRMHHADLDPVLEEHLERFREVFEDAAIGMATMTLSGRLVRANRSLGRLLDRSTDSLVGVALADLVDVPGAVHDSLLRLNAGESLVQVEHHVQERGLRLYRSILSPVIDAAGRPLYIFLQVQDITRQAAAEAELRRTEARFRLLVEAVEDYAIFMLDPTGHIASWNAGAQRSKGYAAEEIIGRHFRVFYPPEKQQEKHPEHELELAVRDGRYEEEGWRVRKDGSLFWAHVTITAVHDPDGALVGFAKVTRDTTERREMLQQQEEASRQLAEVNELLERANHQLAEAAEQQAHFFAVTAHELRAPVSVLTGSAETLARHHDQLEPEERRDIAAGVTRSSAQLRRLLDDLLTASRLQARRLALNPTELDLGEHLESVVGAIRRSSDDAELKVSAEPGLRVHADPVRLTQILDNLAMNALRHGRPPVTVDATRRGDLVEVVFRDAGEGVPAELEGRLFERFATGSSKGTGLGLFLVRELARAHGGEATYRREDRAFVVSLPWGGEG